MWIFLGGLSLQYFLRVCPSQLGDGLLRERHPGQTNKEHSAEFSDLSNQQTKALTDAIFVGMTARNGPNTTIDTPAFWRFCEEMGRVESSLT